MRIPLRLSARVVLLLWVGFQFHMLSTDSTGNVAVWAHIGGFVAGMALVSLFKDKDFPLLDRGTPH